MSKKKFFIQRKRIIYIFSEIFVLVLSYLVFFKSGSNDARYYLISGASLSLILFLFLINMYEWKALSISSVLVNGNRNSITLLDIKNYLYSFLIFTQELDMPVMSPSDQTKFKLCKLSPPLIIFYCTI